MKAYKASLPRSPRSGELPKLYFVKLDIRGCFDTISQDRLLNILERILSEDVYAVSRHVSLFVHRDRPLRRFRREAQAVQEFVDFPKFAFDLAKQMSGTVFVDQVRRSAEKREQVLKLLREHVKENIVKVCPCLREQRSRY